MMLSRAMLLCQEEIVGGGVVSCLYGIGSRCKVQVAKGNREEGGKGRRVI